MNLVSHLLATTATLLAVGIAGIAAIGARPGVQPMVPLGVLWLSLLGWGFHTLLGIRHQLEADPGAFHAKSDRSVDAMLFRILQESLANVARHAQATEVKITLVRSGDLLTLQVRDNGIGMAGHRPTRGCGLAGIADRVAAAGGKFVIDSQPGAGTLLSLSIPLSRPMATL